MISWDQHFIDMARHVSTRSKDPSTRVGAVIVDTKCRVIGQGYNGFPRGVADSADRYEDRGLKYELVVHAEANAILNASNLKDLDGCTLYSPFFPCPHCAGLIIQSGIKEVVYTTNPADERYAKRREIAEMMFREAGVAVREHVDEL